MTTRWLSNPAKSNSWLTRKNSCTSNCGNCGTRPAHKLRTTAESFGATGGRSAGTSPALTEQERNLPAEPGAERLLSYCHGGQHDPRICLGSGQAAFRPVGSGPHD